MSLTVSFDRRRSAFYNVTRPPSDPILQQQGGGGENGPPPRRKSRTPGTRRAMYPPRGAGPRASASSYTTPVYTSSGPSATQAKANPSPPPFVLRAVSQGTELCTEIETLGELGARGCRERGKKGEDEGEGRL